MEPEGSQGMLTLELGGSEKELGRGGGLTPRWEV